ncbi:hypothetical protein [Stenotrophomonas maltophilia]|uniref:hypothetical protein n=1 Tax=Stenotrophomonas maltophilia TaxID=40324 RepID=UPI001311B68E|nr:hypothetical protein [Stenotrophomonas maltophilia]EKU9985891.1 hypothetical protein [Stenotrophomonas maltophilia]
MSETLNIAEVASKISKEIFIRFGWHAQPRQDDNFECLDSSHKGGKSKDKEKKLHPTDVIFSYQDPYADRRIYLLTDLKSYKADSIKYGKIRSALQSLAMSVECAQHSADWKTKFAIDQGESHDVRGLLFVHNHDGGYAKKFIEELKKVNVRTLSMRDGVTLHYFGPDDISRLYRIAVDIKLLMADGEMSAGYTFYYPDLMLARRSGGMWDQQATVEVLAGPFVVIRYPSTDVVSGGYVIYYNRAGGTQQEFEYLIDCLSRFQVLESCSKIVIRMAGDDVNDDYKSNFHGAVQNYARAWGFDSTRKAQLSSIFIDRIQQLRSAYNPGDCGWRD